MPQTIVEEIEIQAPPERVFAAWTDASQVLSWWGDDQTYRIAHWEADLRPGGAWLSRGRAADGKEFSVSGEYRRFEPPHFLSFTWTPDWTQEPETLVELEFTSTETGTLLKLTHSGFAAAAARDSYANGWPRVIGWMKRYAEAA